MKKQSSWKTKGMNQDMSVSAFSPEFAFENMNLRLSTNDGNTLLSWVNERGTKAIDVRISESLGDYSDFSHIPGTAIGTAVLNNYLVLFMTNCEEDNPDEPDRIYRFHYPLGESFLIAKKLYGGHLNFDVQHPIETLVSYESEDIQKVYWLDGQNQPRLINVADSANTSHYSDTFFDFVPTLLLHEKVSVQKVLGGGGAFAPGVIQYAFTYYNKYGQESNIFYTTPLYYISHHDRGASPEDKVDNTFNIEVSKVDPNFDYLRIYSIQRTSINSTPICKRIQDIDLSGIEGDAVCYIDSGYSGNSIDPMELQFKGGRKLIASTMEQKDNTLFFGDFSSEETDLTEEVSKDMFLISSVDSNNQAYTRTFYPTVVSSHGYVYANQLTSFDSEGNDKTSVPCGGFKWGNYYRCGVQFQDNLGRWTPPVYIKDEEVRGLPSTTLQSTNKTPTPGAQWRADIDVRMKAEGDNVDMPSGQPTMATGKSYLLDNVGIKNSTASPIELDSKVCFVLYDNLGQWNEQYILKGTIKKGGGLTVNSGQTKYFSIEFASNDRQCPISAENMAFAAISQLGEFKANCGVYIDGICYACTNIGTNVIPFKLDEAVTLDVVFQAAENVILDVKNLNTPIYPIPETPTNTDWGDTIIDDSSYTPVYGDGGEGISVVLRNVSNEDIYITGHMYIAVFTPDKSDWAPINVDIVPVSRGYAQYLIKAGTTAVVPSSMLSISVNASPNEPNESVEKYLGGELWPRTYWRVYSWTSDHDPAVITAECGSTHFTENGQLVFILKRTNQAKEGRIIPSSNPTILGGTRGQSSTPVLRGAKGVSANTSVSVSVPVIRGRLNSSASSTFSEIVTQHHFRKIRPVVVFPNIQDRIKLCQGVICPTLYTDNHRGVSSSMKDPEGNEVNNENKMTKDIYAQSSWFFRPVNNSETITDTINVPNAKQGLSVGYYNCNSHLRKEENEGWVIDDNPMLLKRTEIQGLFDIWNQYKVDWNTLTYHSPDVEFDTALKTIDYSSGALGFSDVGTVTFTRTYSDIDVQTETPTISNEGGGFDKKSYTGAGAEGIISGLFYDDYLVDDNKPPGTSDDENTTATGFYKLVHQKISARFMVYLWNKTGSLNNDITRPAGQGVSSAVLKKKIISNLRFADTELNSAAINGNVSVFKTQLFHEEGAGILKLNLDDTNYASMYFGNVDTMLVPDNPDGTYFAYIYNDNNPLPADITSQVNLKTCSLKGDTRPGLWWFRNGQWESPSGKTDDDFFGAVGEDFPSLLKFKESVRMKYKSTSHLVITGINGDFLPERETDGTLRILQLERAFDNSDESKSRTNFINNIMFGGSSSDAKMENLWLPCGEPVDLLDVNGNVKSDIEFEYSYGDTYYQRWDCLKTYAFTPEDINQVVEIGSFMLESFTNLDGRYDRNRGQLSNLYMSPVNFNLLNPVYSQKDNFFSYRILDRDKLGRKHYTNQVTWSMTKTSGADVDLWTNVTLASAMELDGDKGPINRLVRFNDQLLAFQDRGIAQIMYNENVQISASQGVAIELANSGKVQGKRYVSDSIGCVNKWSVASTPAGIYFMDSIDKNIYTFNGQLSNLSSSMGMNSWVKKAIPATTVEWTPYNYINNNVKMEGFGNFVAYNDRQNNDVYFINRDTALAFSEKLSAFTSFYDYGNTPYFCNFDDGGIWVRNCTEELTEKPFVALFEHQKGEYCNFFGINKPYWMTLVGNPEPQTDKIFTNLEFRACVDGDGELQEQAGKFTFTLPFDSLETWNEYQRGRAFLSNRDGHDAMRHHTPDMIGSLKRKFRIWRCDIPRDNADELSVFDSTFNETFLAPVRRKHPNDRMRNPWLYLKLMKNAAADGEFLDRLEVHDLLMTYFN